MRSRVLIVDDHPLFRVTARATLEAGGMDVVGEAADGRGALDAAAATAPDVVLLDIQLPDMDGFEVARHLGTLDPRPDVVLTSTRDAADYGKLLTDSSVRGFVPKSQLTIETMSAMLSL